MKRILMLIMVSIICFSMLNPIIPVVVAQPIEDPGTDREVRTGDAGNGDPIPMLTASMLPLFGPSGELRPVSTVNTSCDSGLALNSADPVDAAKAIDICKISSGESDWGLVSAQWVMADGAPAINLPSYALGHGIMNTFGPNVMVRKGSNLLALSSGTARRPSDPGYVAVDADGYDKAYTSNHPFGYPKEEVSCVGMCPLTRTPHDVAALKVVLRTPIDAIGLSFDFKFYTSDFPDWTCDVYNDKFVAILSPFPAGQSDGNIAFDSYGNSVSVNSSFIEVCTWDASASCYSCPQGSSQLTGTGFEGHAASTWHTVSTTIEPGTQISLTFIIYDSGDGVYDSTVLIDNFSFILEPYHSYLPLAQRD